MKRPQLQPGQECVWDYPRPPRLEPNPRLVRVEFAGIEIARSNAAWRILETSHPPVYYIPPEDVCMEYVQQASGESFCEWKGVASYYDVVVGERRAARSAWTYERPMAPYGALANAIAFYASRMDACFLDDERVQPQEGDFYGGWITADIVGPFKGAPGTMRW